VFGYLWESKIRQNYYNDQKDYFADKRIINIHPGRLGDLLEYGRSRMRICRGWAFNSVFLLIFSNVFIWTQVKVESPRILISIVISFLLILLIFGNWFTWRELTKVDYRKVVSQAKFLKSTLTIKTELGKKSN
jgi:hypothetical protein